MHVVQLQTHAVGTSDICRLPLVHTAAASSAACTLQHGGQRGGTLQRCVGALPESRVDRVGSICGIGGRSTTQKSTLE